MTKEGQPIRQEPVKNTKERIFAKVGVVLAGVGTVGGAVPVSAETISEKPVDISSKTAVVDKYQGEIPSQQAYDQLIKNGIVVADADVTIYPEVTATPEKAESKNNVKMILQLNKNYFLESNSLVPGENNILKKSDTSPTTINGRTVVPVRMISEALGATVGFDGKTQIITINKDNTEITLKIGSNLMTVKTEGQSKQVTLDVAAQTNKSGRTVVPVRAISEAFGVEVQWNGSNGGSVGIGYTATEWAALFGSATDKTERTVKTIDLESTYKAFQYMAGGQYVDCLNSGINAIKDAKTGAVVVYADGRKIIDQKDLTALGLKTNDCVYVMNGDRYIFSSGKLNKCINSVGKTETITYPANYIFQKPELQWDKKLGIVAVDSDNYRIVGQLTINSSTKKKEFKNLYPKFVMLGTPEQRIRSCLQNELINKAQIIWASSSESGSVDLSNPFGLNKTDVDEYLKTGGDENCKSFKIVNYVDEKGEKHPGFVCIKGGKYGFNDSLFDQIMQETARLNEINPALIRKMATIDGLRFLSKDMAGQNMFVGATENYYSAYYFHKNFGGVLYINDSPLSNIKNIDDFKNCLGFLLLSESEGLNGMFFADKQTSNINIHTILPGALNENIEIHKNMWVINMVKNEWNKPNRTVDRKEYINWYCSAETNISYFWPEYKPTFEYPKN